MRIDGESLEELRKEHNTYQCGLEAAKAEAYRIAEETKAMHNANVENKQKIKNLCEEHHKVVKSFYDKLVLEKERLEKSITETNGKIVALQNKKNYYIGQGEKASALVDKCNAEIDAKSSELAAFEASLKNVKSSITAILLRLSDADTGSQAAALELSTAETEAAKSKADNEEKLVQVDNSATNGAKSSAQIQADVVRVNAILEELKKSR